MSPSLSLLRGVAETKRLAFKGRSVLEFLGRSVFVFFTAASGLLASLDSLTSWRTNRQAFDSLWSAVCLLALAEIHMQRGASCKSIPACPILKQSCY